jgi:hypothetical protein
MKALALIALLACTGCATQPYAPQTYKVTVTVVVGEPDYIQDLYEAKTGNCSDVGGFYEFSTRTIYVDRDVWTGRPVEKYLGHELNHALYGNWHK